MTHSEFKKSWNGPDDLRPISLATLNRFNLTEDAKEFLNKAGLPESCAPFLSFAGDITPGTRHDSISLLTEDLQFLDTGFSKYVLIGTTGSGDPIVLDTANGCRVEWLNHENNFSPGFINSSVDRLAGCLLAYQQFVTTINTENGDDSYLESRFSDAHFNSLRETLKAIDERAVSDGFWKDELDMLLANREG